jgi:kynurenine formamidase
MKMRAVPEAELSEWHPPTYSVDGNGKVIAARAGSPNNWGRWGDLDQKGTANLLTAERAARAARLVKTGKRYSLALPLGNGQLNPGTRPNVLHLFSRSTADFLLGDRGVHGVQTSDDIVVLPLQAATQLDGHGHFAHDDSLYNGYWAGLVTAGSGARRLGIHHHADGIVGRGVLLDVARVVGIDPFEASITATMLEATMSAQQVALGPGDILLVRTGFLGAWLDKPELRVRRRQSGLDFDTIPWLAERDVAMVAADNRTVEAVPGPPGQPLLPWHRAALRDLGLLVGELFDLDELAEDCAATDVYEFLFVAAPLPVVNAVGSPLNPLVIK